jgi:Flp pilus assembly protein TadD
LLLSCNPESRVKNAIQRGEKLLREGNNDEAALNFRKAIQINANSGEAYYGLGRALFTPANLPEAYANLLRASELLPDRTDVKTELGDAVLTIYLATSSRPANLRQQLIKIGGELSKASPNSADAFRFRAYVQMADRRPAEAIQTLMQGLRVRPDDQRSRLALVKALLMDGRVEEADSSALQAISKNKAYFPLYDLMISHYSMAPETAPKAERFLRLKVENNPYSADALLSLAGFHRKQKNADALVATLAPLLNDPEHFPLGYLQAADFYSEAEAFGPAEETLRQAIASRPAVRDAARIRLSRVLFLYRRPDEAFSLADQLAKERPNDKEIALLRADLAERAQRTDRYEPAISDIRSLLATQPNEPGLRPALGRLLLAKDDLDGAAKEFEQALKTGVANTGVRLALANIHLKKKSYTQALLAVNPLLSADPGNPSYRLLRAMCLRGQGNFAEARSELTALDSDFPNRSGVLLELAYLNLAEGRASRAEAVFRRLYQPDRPNLQVLDGLARSLVAQGQVDRAMELLLSTRLKHPSPGLDLAIAEVSFSSRRYDQAIKFFSSADKDLRLGAEELGRFAEALRQIGDLKQAVTVARRARDLDPQRFQLSAFLAFLLQTAGNDEEAVALYRTVLKSQPSNLDAANNLAYLLAEQGRDLEQASQLAERCVRGRPEDDGFLDTLGLVVYKQGRLGYAIDMFQRALRRNPSRGLYRYHLALALLAKGDRSQARRELEKASSQSLDPAEKAKIQELLKSGG